VVPANDYTFTHEFHNAEPFRVIFLRDFMRFSLQRTCVSCGVPFMKSGTDAEDICLLHMERFQVGGSYTRKKLQQR
jgi:hypothetical protein